MDQVEENEERNQRPEPSRELVRIERNVDSLPIWAPSQYAKTDERVYPVPWRSENAEVRVQKAGKYGQLRAFDKIVLTALTQLWQEQGRDPAGWVTFTIMEIIRVLGRKNDQGGKLYAQIKDSLHRLRGSMIQYIDSFFVKEIDAKNQNLPAGEWISDHDVTILADLWIVEPRKMKKGGLDIGEQLAFVQFTRARLDLKVVRNLLGNFTRPISPKLLDSLTERGVLFESYVNSVLYRNEKVSKDVFDLHEQLGLSTKGIQYGSQLTNKMRGDLDKMVGDSTHLLGRYAFSRSKTKARSQNVNLYRVSKPPFPLEKKKEQDPQPSVRKSGHETISVDPDAESSQRVTDIDAEHDRIDREVWTIRQRLQDEGDSDFNIRRIVERIPKATIETGIYEALSRYKDGLTSNRASYFVGVMKNKAREKGIDLGLPDSQNGAGAGPEKI